ncbi:DUF2382 domain-containing protein [Sphingomonas ginkgonis]|uniref:DUF2382 domain-containing protein n=1 Tax=Sphingomonas ginkgonis TaxID=2315330 RepID=A0A3R9YJE6_9SPHN|nr:DUF2382 domain-containing protein [Sphingomonas ginkgonis]RST31290.1 DUF2382 domain-containing protein [Sphingomonas ginkgonis]
MTIEPSGPHIAIVDEVLSLGRRIVDGRQVRVRTIVEEKPEVLHGTLTEGMIGIERVAVGAFVGEAPQQRQEGEVTITPLIGELSPTTCTAIEQAYAAVRSGHD